MKNFILFIVLAYSISVFSQKVNSYILNKEQIVQRELMNLSYFPIYRAYEYQDKDGTHELILCENQKTVTENDTLNTKIQAICGMNNHGFLEKWTINDLVEDTEPKETDIWFWTKYCSTKDLDDDGYIEPIIVYGSRNEYGEIRRVKIITIYKNKKYIIRAVECILDDCRSFKKDSNWDLLPQKIKIHIAKLVEKIRTDQGILLKDG